MFRVGQTFKHEVLDARQRIHRQNVGAEKECKSPHLMLCPLFQVGCIFQNDVCHSLVKILQANVGSVSIEVPLTGPSRR
jgi:hypothetical protein